jgi:hypothetical protein
MRVIGRSRPFGIIPQDIGSVRILLTQAGRKGGRAGPPVFALVKE